VFFVIRSAKQLFEKSFLGAHLGGCSSGSLSSAATIRRFMSSAPLGQKKPKPLIPHRGTRADQRICSVRLSHLHSYLPLNKGSKGYFLRCYHFQYLLKPLFVICIKIFSLYSMNISYML